MAKLYFKYGAMGSSKTATALITKYNYEERGMRVWLMKPAASHAASSWKIFVRSHWNRISCSLRFIAYPPFVSYPL